VRFIYKDFPLTEIHPWAMHASVDANCLAAQSSDVYWSYVDYLHSHGEEVNGPDRNEAKSFAALIALPARRRRSANSTPANSTPAFQSRTKPK
jgi:protein-disulfide isomerase